MKKSQKLAPYSQSIAGTLLAARESVMAPIRPILRAAGVTEQQWRVLRVLLDEGALDPSRLAQSALLLAPSVTRILRELTERGLIGRVADPHDGRRYTVTISATGQALVEETTEHSLKVLNGYARQFGKKRLEALLMELRHFTEAIDQAQSLRDE